MTVPFLPPPVRPDADRLAVRKAGKDLMMTWVASDSSERCTGRELCLRVAQFGWEAGLLYRGPGRCAAGKSCPAVVLMDAANLSPTSSRLKLCELELQALGLLRGFPSPSLFKCYLKPIVVLRVRPFDRYAPVAKFHFGNFRRSLTSIPRFVLQPPSGKLRPNAETMPDNF